MLKLRRSFKSRPVKYYFNFVYKQRLIYLSENQLFSDFFCLDFQMLIKYLCIALYYVCYKIGFFLNLTFV